jgi:adenylosuccinate synthase
VTSSSTITGGVSLGLGVAPSKINRVIGIVKAYTTRVGSGPFPTELHDETGERLRVEGNEYGATTGRNRRCGWIDLPQLKYSIMINGVTDIALTKLDVLAGFDPIKYCEAYKDDKGNISEQLPYDLVNIEVQPIYKEHKGWSEDISKVKEIESLPDSAKEYIGILEKTLETPISFVSVGPERSALIVRK